MYAVIKTGGKQYRVAEGQTLRVEKLPGSAGDKVTFEPLLVVEDDGTTHFGKDASKSVVTGKLSGETKGEKVQIFKYKAKTGYSRKTGHRQSLTLVEIEDVKLGKPAAAPKKKAEDAPADEAAPKDEKTAE